jgi:cytochrome c-type biogenesis protein CcmH
MRALSFLLMCVLLLGAGATRASIDVYEFDSPEKEARFRALASELRCPKCQNQNVNDSSAPLAKDIKDRVVLLIDEGKSDQEIVDYMVERYGEFVTYRPRMSVGVALLWGVPAGAGLLVLIGLLVSRRKPSMPTPAIPVDQQRIKTLLDQYTNKTDR